MRRPAGGALALTALLLLTACGSAGRLTDGHLAYNEAVRRAADQELLLNIVRLRYLDSLEFLATTSINSTLSFSVGVEASVGRSGGETSSGAGLSARYSSTPTFSFVPQRGGAFASQLTEPVELDTLVLLVAATRDAHTVFRVLVSWLSGLDNREGVVDPDFIEVTRSLDGLLLAGDALFGFRQVENAVTPPMPRDSVSPGAMLQARGEGLAIRSDSETEEIVFVERTSRPALYLSERAAGRAELLEALHLDPSLVDYPIQERTQPGDDENQRAIRVETRSLLHAMAFLSQGVDVPQAHLDAGLVAASGSHPAIEAVPMDDLFRIHSSADKPEDAAIAVRHRETWFAIRDTDQATKRTFFLLTEMFRLALEQDASRAPVLTLPVAGNG